MVGGGGGFGVGDDAFEGEAVGAGRVEGDEGEDAVREEEGAVGVDGGVSGTFVGNGVRRGEEGRNIP